jgi:DNA repair protein RadC
MWQHLYDAPVSTLRDPSPSPEDVNVTRQLVRAGKLLDQEVLDHIIIGRNRWVSLKERGLGFDA